MHLLITCSAEADNLQIVREYNRSTVAADPQEDHSSTRLRASASSGRTAQAKAMHRGSNRPNVYGNISSPAQTNDTTFATSAQKQKRRKALSSKALQLASPTTAA